MTALVLSLVLSTGMAAAPPGDAQAAFWPRLQATIQRYLGLPYAWGAAGQKSFDCSGFVWRVHYENGVLFKRTTARKLYMCLPPVNRGEQWKPGNIVFFDDLKHCGIVHGPTTFYHAQSSKGTHLSDFDPYWRPKICGFRKIPPP